jgi:thiamine pyrophosphokinase
MRIYCAVTRILFTTSSAFLHSSAGSLLSNKRRLGNSIRNRIVTRNMSNNNVSSSTPAVLLHKSPFLDNDDDNDEDTQTQTATALVILNSPIQKPPSPLFQALWNKSQYRVCADGGANRLYRSTVHVPTVNATATATDTATTATDSGSEQKYIPNLIIGDLDSLQTVVGDYYKKSGQGCSIVCDPDQDRNDLDKSLGAILKQYQQQTTSNNNKIGRVLVYGAFGGRFDQEMGCIQALYQWSHQFDYNMWLYDDQTVCWLLPAHITNHIQLPRFDETVKSVLGEGPTCGLIPIGGAVDSVTTVGFKWDLHEHATAFGGLVSTSNRVMAETVTVTSSHPLVFTAEIYSGIPEQQNSEEEEEAPTIWKNEQREE